MSKLLVCKSTIFAKAMLSRRILRTFSNFVKDSTSAIVRNEEKELDVSELTYCNVALMGADTKLGELTAFLLKQNPLITTLHLQGTSGVEGLKEDLSHMDTRCRVVAHSGTDNYKNALRTANVVVLLSIGGFSSRTSIGDRVMAEGNRICKLADICSRYARRAIILVCATPISVMTPLVSDIFRRTHWYHPARIIGFTGPTSVFVNSEVGRHQSFDPNIVDVPLIGGPDLESTVPVFSKAVPCPVSKEDAVKVLARLREVETEDFNVKSQPSNVFKKIEYPEAMALNRLISAIAYGLHGDEMAVGYAHVRSTIVRGSRFMVSQVRFGRHGVEHNYGIPRLSLFEQDLLERGLAKIYEKEMMAEQYLEYYLSRRRDVLPPFKRKEVEDYIEQRKCLMRI